MLKPAALVLSKTSEANTSAGVESMVCASPAENFTVPVSGSKVPLLIRLPPISMSMVSNAKEVFELAFPGSMVKVPISSTPETPRATTRVSSPRTSMGPKLRTPPPPSISCSQSPSLVWSLASHVVGLAPVFVPPSKTTRLEFASKAPETVKSSFTVNEALLLSIFNVDPFPTTSTSFTMSGWTRPTKALFVICVWANISPAAFT